MGPFGSCKANEDCCSNRCSRFGVCHIRPGAGNGEEVMGEGYGSGLEGGAHGMEGGFGSGLEDGANGMGGNYGARNPPTKDWPRCAFEDQTCFCTGQVAYGTAFLPGVTPNPGWW